MTAARRARSGTRADPAIVSALLDEGGAHYQAGRFDAAERAYRRADRQSGGDFRAVYSLAVIDLRRARYEAAQARFRKVALSHPDHFGAWHNLGVALQALRRWGEAGEAFGKALALQPEAAETAFALARVLAVEGETDAAVALYRQLAATEAARARALARLAILKPEAVTDAELGNLRAEAARADAVESNFALGAALEARGDFRAAFDAFSVGAGQKLRRLAAGAETPEAVEQAHAASAQSVMSLFTAEFVASHSGKGDARTAPIFIVGFPRCGSSLVEQILASHPEVHAFGETGALVGVVDRAGIDGVSSRRLAGAYLTELRSLGWRGDRRPVDKTLENHLLVGAIALSFPRAVILHCRREPADACVASFCELFATGAETLYDLGQIGREYTRYRAVMDLWTRVLPGRVAEVSYEALVASPETEIRRLVTEACGLPWDPACLEFHKTRRAVATASADQVRRPIFTSSVGLWRRYETRLAPLFEALGPYAPARG